MQSHFFLELIKQSVLDTVKTKEQDLVCPNWLKCRSSFAKKDSPLLCLFSLGSPPVKHQRYCCLFRKILSCSNLVIKPFLFFSTCRCGNNFCATHRYAESHDCTFDYKTEGRKLLEQSNPVVSAPKLPKIWVECGGSYIYYNLHQVAFQEMVYEARIETVHYHPVSRQYIRGLWHCKCRFYLSEHFITLNDYVTTILCL